MGHYLGSAWARPSPAAGPSRSSVSARDQSPPSLLAGPAPEPGGVRPPTPGGASSAGRPAPAPQRALPGRRRTLVGSWCTRSHDALQVPQPGDRDGLSNGPPDKRYPRQAKDTELRARTPRQGRKRSLSAPPRLEGHHTKGWRLSREPSGPRGQM